MDAKHLILLLIGLVMLAKALWSLVFPESMRKTAAWWLKTVKHVNTLAGALYVAAGLALFVLILFQQPLVNWLLGLFGILMVYGGILMIRFTEMERLSKRLILDRKPFMIRLWGAVMLVGAAFLLWVALRS